MPIDCDAWLKWDDDDGTMRIRTWAGDVLFEVAEATESDIRQVCALPEIMAALRELSEAWDDSRAAARVGGERAAYATMRSLEAHHALIALYERLK